MMKTLKFMLAAATAIGIASAAQAVQNKEASTGFEKLEQGDEVITGTRDNVSSQTDTTSYFYYAGDNADDNESAIVAFVDDESPAYARPTGIARFYGADATARANALQVSTGTDPLLRTFSPLSGTKPQKGDTIYHTTYIDTLVQFTVTPSTDTVTPGEDDKLMIYLKETALTDNDGVATGKTATNLVVMAGYCGAEAVVSAKEYKVTNVTVEPGKWYRLTVEVIPDITVEKAGTVSEERSGYVGFVVRINGKDECVFDSPLCELDDSSTAYDETAADIFASSYLGEWITNKMLVLSLLAASGNVSQDTLQAVGFAGEGLVDDLVITTTDPFVAVVNFTLVKGENVSSVAYTVNGEDQYGDEVEDLVADSIIKITSVTYADGYEYDTYTATGLTAADSFNGSTGSFTVTTTEAASLTITAKAATPTVVTPDGAEVTVKSKDAADAIKISATSPDSAVISDADFAKYFTKVITGPAEDGTYTVKAVLDGDVVDADATAADLAGKFDEITEGEVSVTAKPGLYYSVNQGSALGDMKEGERVMAGSDGKVSLKATKFDGAGFYQIMVNFTAE